MFQLPALPHLPNNRIQFWWQWGLTLPALFCCVTHLWPLSPMAQSLAILYKIINKGRFHLLLGRATRYCFSSNFPSGGSNFLWPLARTLGDSQARGLWNRARAAAGPGRLFYCTLNLQHPTSKSNLLCLKKEPNEYADSMGTKQRPLWGEQGL